MDNETDTWIWEAKEYQRRLHRFVVVFSILVILPTCAIVAATALLPWAMMYSFGKGLQDAGATPERIEKFNRELNQLNREMRQNFKN